MKGRKWCPANQVHRITDKKVLLSALLNKLSIFIFNQILVKEFYLTYEFVSQLYVTQIVNSCGNFHIVNILYSSIKFP